MNHPGHIFALALFAAIGVSHTLRPRIWKDYIAWLASQGHGGVALFALLHVLVGSILLALAGIEHWTGWVLTIFGAAHVFKGGLYCLFPEFALQKMKWGIGLSAVGWGVAGVLLLALAGIAAWGAFA